MGVYNEVFKKCPHCESGYGCAQIGYFAGHECIVIMLDDANRLAELFAEEELSELADTLKAEWFECGGGESSRNGCGRSFLLQDVFERRKALASKLFGGS